MRRLAAVLSIDVAGYSRLMGRDEAGTLAALNALRAEVVDPAAAACGGTTVKLMGDGALMEFASAVDAVRFAVAVQCTMRNRNAEVADQHRIQFRIGINIGDIIAEGGDIFGDGVNVAARLEGLAEPGGICIHRNVRDQVRDKLELDFTDLGEVEVKNIARPVRAFHVVLNEKAGALAPASPTTGAEGPRKGLSRPLRVAVGLPLALLLVAGIAWWHSGGPEFEPVDPAAMMRPLPAKPSIAVLAFDDLSQGADQDYLSDAISEAIITELSRFPELFVIARNSSFKYKGMATDVREIARELGVRYVLEGSQQKAGDKLRVTAQLIDAVAGNHIWADSYDRGLSDMFAVQDEISRTIVSTVAGNIEGERMAEIGSAAPANMEAFDYTMRGKEQFRQFSRATHIAAQQMYEKAIEMDPAYVGGYVGLAWIHINGYRWGWTEMARDASLERAREMARQALVLDPKSYEAHWVMGNVHMQAGAREQALAEYERALELNPNAEKVLVDQAELLVYLGRAEDAVRQIDTAIRLNPYHPDWYNWTLGWAQYYAETYEAGLASIRRMTRMPNLARRTEAALLVRLGRTDEAKAVIVKFRENAPDYTLEQVRLNLAGKFAEPARVARFLDDLRVAGLPE